MRHLKQHAGGRQVSPKDVVPVDEGDDIDEDEESEYYPTQNLVPNAWECIITWRIRDVPGRRLGAIRQHEDNRKEPNYKCSEGPLMRFQK